MGPQKEDLNEGPSIWDLKIPDWWLSSITSIDFGFHPLLKSPLSKKAASFLLLLRNDLIALNNNIWGMENLYHSFYGT
jgi:hypothetical protein